MIARSLAAGLLLLASHALAAADRAPLLEGLPWSAAPTASSTPLAQRYFTQAMVLTWGFNNPEAARSFAAAAAHDPRCALCWWGLAWSLGPNVNADMAGAEATRVHAALAQARVVSARANEKTRALIDALAVRHPAEADPTKLDEAGYAVRMLALAYRYPRDATIATLAAEALMNLHPYDWWTVDGKPREWTLDIRKLLAHALALEPTHPGANHYWIHLIESSPRPADAVASADRLATLVPGSGHLLHMPAHVDMRVGRYADAVAVSERAIAADARYLAQADAQQAYRVGYAAHNADFLWAAAAMDGQSARALAAARAAYPVACGTGRNDRSTGILQQYLVLPYFTLVRFARWREILAEALPPEVAEPYPRAIWHYARGTAFARTGRVAEAQRELDAVARLEDDPALATVRIKNINPAQSIVRIARLTLAADLAAAQRRTDDEIELLRQATAIEDALAPDEPHPWLAPTRHALGAALVAAGRADDAARVYREDLAHYPRNGWSLAGLARAERIKGDENRARATERAFDDAWRRADVALSGSRL